MQLDYLHLTRQCYGKDLNKITGEIRFSDSNIQTAIKLSEPTASKMLELVAAELIENAKEISQSLSGIANYNIKAIEGSIGSD